MLLSGCRRLNAMKKIEEQIKGQLNIFEAMNEKPPAGFETKKSKGICDDCLFDEGACVLLHTKTPCVRGISKITKAEGWHRIIKSGQYITGEYPTNTQKRERIEAILLLKTDEIFITTAEGINQAIILPRGTPEGSVIAWRYQERGAEHEILEKEEEKSATT